MHQIMKLFEKYQRQKHSKDMNKYSNYETNPFCNTNRSASLSSVSTADSLGSSFSDFGSTFSVLTYSSDFETLMRWQCLPWHFMTDLDCVDWHLTYHLYSSLEYHTSTSPSLGWIQECFKASSKAWVSPPASAYSLLLDLLGRELKHSDRVNNLTTSSQILTSSMLFQFLSPKKLMKALLAMPQKPIAACLAARTA